MRSRTSEEKRIAAALILITLAIVGYVAGSGRSTAAPAGSTSEASNAATTLNYAAGSSWRSAAAAPTIPGLTIAQPLILAPGGNGARAGLVVGEMRNSEFGPLPPQFLADLHQPPEAEVVDLANTQAYRYQRLSDAGSPLGLSLYTIPTSPTRAMALACYAAPGSAGYMPACERLVSTLTIATANPQTEVRATSVLTPDPGYGRRIGAAASRVNALLGTLRPALHKSGLQSTASGLAERLADGLTVVAESLSKVKPPAAAARAQVTLAQSLKQVSAAYSSLRAGASAGSTDGYAIARTQVYAAEAGLSTALRNFTLIGYQ
jgi:hypothetical protein